MKADYDLGATYSRLEVGEILRRAERAFAFWNVCRQRDEADVFCAALLLEKQWAR